MSSLDPVKYHIEEIPLRNWLGRLGKMRNHHYLFLYSDNDDLIPWTLVEEFADIAATQGNYVVKRKFAGSVHVQHYRKYPKVRHYHLSENCKLVEVITYSAEFI